MFRSFLRREVLDVASSALCALVCDCIGIVVKLCVILCSETLLVIIRSGNCFTKRREIERSRVPSSLSREYKLFKSRSEALVFHVGG